MRYTTHAQAEATTYNSRLVGIPFGRTSEIKFLSDELIKRLPSECLSRIRSSHNRLFAEQTRYDSLAQSDNLVAMLSLQGLLLAGSSLDMRLSQVAGRCSTSPKEVGFCWVLMLDSKSEEQFDNWITWQRNVGGKSNATRGHHAVIRSLDGNSQQVGREQVVDLEVRVTYKPLLPSRSFNWAGYIQVAGTHKDYFQPRRLFPAWISSLITRLLPLIIPDEQPQCAPVPYHS